MEPALKFVLLSFFVFMISIGLFKAYEFCNDKIAGSSGGWELLAFSMLLIIINIVLLIGGLYLLVEAFRFLT